MLGPGYCSRYSWAVRSSNPGGSERLSSPLPSRLALGSNQPTVRCPSLERGIKRLGRGVYHPPHLASNLSVSTAIPLLPPMPPLACYGATLLRYCGNV